MNKIYQIIIYTLFFIVFFGLLALAWYRAKLMSERKIIKLCFSADKNSNDKNDPGLSMIFEDLEGNEKEFKIYFDKPTIVPKGYKFLRKNYFDDDYKLGFILEPVPTIRILKGDNK